MLSRWALKITNLTPICKVHAVDIRNFPEKKRTESRWRNLIKGGILSIQISREILSSFIETTYLRESLFILINAYLN